jgi:imidazolonepropionase-like amidohydrolase
MKPLIPILILLFADGCSAAGDATPATRGQIAALVNVTVLPMTSEALLPGHTVIVRDGRIAALGPTAAVDVPAGAQRIDGTGKYLIPGMTDAHVHLRHQSELLSYLAHGVTTVVQLSGPSDNLLDAVEVRRQVERGDVLGPAIYTSGRILDGDPPIFPGVSTVVQTPEEAERAVEAQLADGVDLIKVYNNLRADVLRAVIRAAHERGATVWGHIPRIDGRSTALQRALTAQLDVIAHAEEVFFTLLYREVEAQLDRGVVPAIGDDQIAEAVRLIREHGATVIPNLSFVAMTRVQLDAPEELLADPEAQYLSPAVFDMWRQQNPTIRPDLPRFDLRERGKRVVVQRLTRALHEAGVPLLLGTDASAPGMFPGKSAWIELSELVNAGLTPFEALRTATSGAGAFLHRFNHQGPSVGTIAVGSRADLVLLDANPMTVISNVARIAGVVVRGKWYTRSQIDAIRAEQAGNRARR